MHFGHISFHCRKLKLTSMMMKSWRGKIFPGGKLCVIWENVSFRWIFIDVTSPIITYPVFECLRSRLHRILMIFAAGVVSIMAVVMTVDRYGLWFRMAWPMSCWYGRDWRGCWRWHWGETLRLNSQYWNEKRKCQCLISRWVLNFWNGVKMG